MINSNNTAAIRRLEGSDIAFDVHVRRVFLRTGIAERDDQRHMIEAARRLHPGRLGALDYPALWIGHEWCRPTDPACAACPTSARDRPFTASSLAWVSRWVDL